MTPAEEFTQKRLEVEQKIRQYAPAELHAQIISLIRPAIALNANLVDDAHIPIGASKFGGCPDVPENFEWPQWNDRPLGFLAQINLEEVAPFDIENIFPKTGLLCFFYDQDNYSGNTAKDGWPIIKTDNHTLQRWSNNPDNMIWHLAPHSISMSIVPDIPLSNLLLLLTSAEWMACERIWQDWTFFPHKLVGYMDDIDRASERDFSHSYNLLNPLNSPTRPEEWQMLLQINSGDSDNPIDHIEANVYSVRVSYGITKNDLSRQRWDEARFGYDWS